MQAADAALKEAKEVASNTADTFVEEVYHSSGMSQQQGGAGRRQPNMQTRDRWAHVSQAPYVPPDSAHGRPILLS